MVKFPTDEKAKEFIKTLEGTDMTAKLLPPRKRKVEPMGYSDDGQYYIIILDIFFVRITACSSLFCGLSP